MKLIQQFCIALTDKDLMPRAAKVAILVGSILFLINHGSAWLEGKMTRDRWIASCFSFFVPYAVNIHGQLSCRSRPE